MSSWRKKVFGGILIALLVLAVVFWGSAVGACSLVVLIQGIQVFLYNHYSSQELAKTFHEDGKNVKGWRN